MPVGDDGVLEAAQHYAQHMGWSVIPIHADGKKPLVAWREYQEVPAPLELVTEWFSKWPLARLGIVTGAVSGLVVVDCDNPEASRAARELGMDSVWRASTPSGEHFYWAHPRDGTRWGPRVGGVSHHHWPAVRGLDLRADGGYVVAPPTPGYAWQSEDKAPRVLSPWDEARRYSDTSNGVTTPGYPGFPGYGGYETQLPCLADTEIGDTEWERTRLYANKHYPETHKLPTGQGNGRNVRVLRFLGERRADGVTGPHLTAAASRFMSAFYEEPLPVRELLSVVASVERMERDNHPEREAAPFRTGDAASSPSPAEAPPPARLPLLHVSDGPELKARAQAESYYVSPWLRAGVVVQVYGYSGSGKTLLAQLLLSAAATGAGHVGPFACSDRPVRVLYIDLENGAYTLANRFGLIDELLGDPGENFAVFSSALAGGVSLQLNTAEGRATLAALVRQLEPDVVCIDTIRSAFPGLEENKAEAWEPFSKLAAWFRRHNIASVWLHHGNKPTEFGPGSEAGSTAQLVHVDTQLSINQVFESKDVAKARGGVWDGHYEKPVWPKLESPQSTLQAVWEVKYGKVRDWTPEHQALQWMALARDTDSGAHKILASSSVKQKAQHLASLGDSNTTIASRLGLPLELVKSWLPPSPPLEDGC